MSTEAEAERRRNRVRQIIVAQAGDAERMAEIAEVDAARAARAEELRPVLAELLAGGSAAEFRAKVDAWSRRPGYNGFNSPNGQMFVNQMIGSSSDEQVAEVFRQILTLPDGSDEASAKIQLGVDFVTEIRKGSYPTPTRVPFLCSFFWGWQAPERWPTYWPSAVRTLTDLGWLEPTGDLADDYLAFEAEAQRTGVPLPELLYALHWFDRRRFVGLDEGLLIYCQRDGDVPDREVVPRHTTKRLRTHALSLTGEPAAVEQSVAELAELIRERAYSTGTGASTAMRMATSAARLMATVPP